MKVIFDPILGALRKSDADGVGTGTVTGTGTAGYIAAWTTATNIANSLLWNNGVSVGLGTITPSAKAIYEMSSTTQGVLFPRMTQAQRDAIAPGSAANLGLFIYNTDTALYDYWDGSAWNEIMTSIVTTELEPVSTQTNTPTATTLGLRALIGTAPTGAWVGRANQIAEGDGAGGYTYTIPVLNNIVYITDTLTTKRYNGSAWIAYPGTAILQNGNSLATNMSIGTNQTSGSRGLYFKTSNTNRLLVGGAGNFHVATNTYFGDLTTTPAAAVHIKSAAVSYGLRIDTTTVNSALTFYDSGVLALNAGAVGAAPSPLITMGSYYDSAGNVSVSHIALYGSTFGFGLSTSALNYIVPSGNTHDFYVNSLSSFQFRITESYNYTPNTIMIGSDSYSPSNGKLFVVGGNSSFGGVSIPSALVDIRGGADIAGTFGLKVRNDSSVVNFYVEDDGKVSSLLGYWIGGTKVLSKPGTSNIFVGAGAGAAWTTGSYNTLVGFESGVSLTDGNYNALLGYRAGFSSTGADETVAIGREANYNNLTANGGVVIGGYAMHAATTNTETVCIGYISADSVISTNGSIFIGNRCGTGWTTSNYNTLLGGYISSTKSDATTSIAIGYQAIITADNQWVVGHYQAPINNAYFGRGVSVAANTDLGTFAMSVAGIAAGNTDISSSNSIFYLDASVGTGTGVGGKWGVRTAPAGSTGSTRNALVEMLMVYAEGDIVAGKQAALATTATVGDFYVPSCAGVPTGVPTGYTGKIAIRADSTNNKLYIYSGGAWVALN